MPRALGRTIAATLAGAVAGALILILFYQPRAGFDVDFDRPLPSFISGVYGLERDDTATFAWTAGRATVRMTGLDRRTTWTCTLRARGPRPDGSEPELTMAVDGSHSRVVQLTGEYADFTIEAPPRPDRPGLTLTLAVAPTFLPASDPRELGMQVDRLACATTGFVLPPTDALHAAMVAAGGFALVAAVAGLTPIATGAIVLIAALSSAMLLVAGGVVHGPYPSLMARLALGTAIGLLAVLGGPRLVRAGWLSPAARLATVAAGTLLFMKLAALTHPLKPLIDAVFQAHRLDWVLEGRYFFTQPLPDGVQFPYAIGLYVAAAPWADLVTDHVLLLRLVVLVAEAVAGLLLYAVVVAHTRDRLAGVAAAFLFHLVPLPFIVIGNANLTNVFAQAVALMAMVLVALWPANRKREWLAALALTALVSLAFLSHVSTVLLLAGTLGVVAAITLQFGGADERRRALWIAGAVVVAGVIAVGTYYRHFPEVYARAFDRVATTSAVSPEPPAAAADRPAVLVRQLAWHERATDAVRQTVSGIGWPILVLAGAGGWHLSREAAGTPTARLFASWAGAWFVLLLAGTLTRVDTQYQRYAAEFLGRVNLAFYPVAVILAAVGASALWRRRALLARGAGVLLMAAAIAIGIASWWAWLA